MDHLRLYIACSKWKPSRNEWIQAMRLVQPEERTRIDRFVYKRDAKSSMAGRLLMRRSLADLLSTNQSVRLARTDTGRPYCLDDADVSFNVSHQGEYAVIAAEKRRGLVVGVDVMKIEYPKNRTIEKFFSNFTRQFSAHEWTTITEPFDEWDQLENFYRLWCLKESYVKAIGTGINMNLKRLDFHISESLSEKRHASETRLYFDDKLVENVKFEERKLDSRHVVAVALLTEEKDLQSYDTDWKEMDVSTYLSGNLSLDHDSEFIKLWQSFDAKEK